MRILVKKVYAEFYNLPLGFGLIGVFGSKDGKVELVAIKPVKKLANLLVPVVEMKERIR